jgi:hypothetical protein
MRSVWFIEQLRQYYCSSALDRGRVGHVPLLTALETRQFKLRTNLRRLCSQSGDAHRNTEKKFVANQEMHIATQGSICAVNQEREIKQRRRDRPRCDA